MAQVNQIRKSGHMNLWDIVKFQVVMHCHLNKIVISDSDIECITLLAMNGETELTTFCNAACEVDEKLEDSSLAYEHEIFKTPQSVRNSVNKIENIGLINKKGKSKKKVSVDPSMNLQSNGNIFIEIKFLRKDESQEA